ncbi:RAVE subunit 2/Rogdi [Whalleya microplaca]|nr:RAVE subunit 2/Rogdi [Whalleya microplaca]
MLIEDEDDDGFVVVEPYYTSPYHHPNSNPFTLQKTSLQNHPPKQARELAWLLTSLQETLKSLKHGLEDCYALLAPIEPGSTLALTTPRHETIKGTVTRVGTRIVKCSIHARLRTLPPQLLVLDPSHPIHLPALTTLNTLLTESVDLATLCVSEEAATAPFLAAQLRQLHAHIADAGALLRGPPARSAPADAAWTRASVALGHFSPPLARNLSFFLTVQDASLVLYLRALEPADAPMNFGAKLALAIGTARRLEHDEADRVFRYCCDGESHVEGEPVDRGSPVVGDARPRRSGDRGAGGHGDGEGGDDGKGFEVFVREKVRVESADPSLLSLSAKLSALANTLSLARRNLAAVMGEEMED